MIEASVKLSFTISSRKYLHLLLLLLSLWKPISLNMFVFVLVVIIIFLSFFVSCRAFFRTFFHILKQWYFCGWVDISALFLSAEEG